MNLANLWGSISIMIYAPLSLQYWKSDEDYHARFFQLRNTPHPPKMCPNFKSDKIKPVLMCRRSSYTIIAKFQLLNLQRLGISLVRKFVVVKMRIMDLLKKSSTPRIALRAICTLSSLPTLSNQHCATVHTTFCTALHYTELHSAVLTLQYAAVCFAL